jgi:hypothetical protein
VVCEYTNTAEGAEEEYVMPRVPNTIFGDQQVSNEHSTFTPISLQREHHSSPKSSSRCIPGWSTTQCLGLALLSHAAPHSVAAICYAAGAHDCAFTCSRIEQTAPQFMFTTIIGGCPARHIPLQCCTNPILRRTRMVLHSSYPQTVFSLHPIPTAMNPTYQAFV